MLDYTSQCYRIREEIFIHHPKIGYWRKERLLGISWMVGGGICFILGLALLVINFVKPRKTGDVNLLSWNQEKTKRDEQSAAAAEGVTTGFEK